MAIRFAAAKGNTPDFSPQQLSSPRVGSNAGSAAGAVSLSGVYGALRSKSPKYDEIGGTAADVRLAENMAAKKAENDFNIAKLGAYGTAARGAMTAKMYDEQTSAAKSGGMTSMLGGVAGGLLSLASGGIA